MIHILGDNYRFGANGGKLLTRFNNEGKLLTNGTMIVLLLICYIASWFTQGSIVSQYIQMAVFSIVAVLSIVFFVIKIKLNKQIDWALIVSFAVTVISTILSFQQIENIRTFEMLY